MKYNKKFMFWIYLSPLELKYKGKRCNEKRKMGVDNEIDKTNIRPRGPSQKTARVSL